MVVVQVAISACLLIGCGLLIRSMVNLATVDLGFDTDNIVGATYSIQAREDSSNTACYSPRAPNNLYRRLDGGVGAGSRFALTDRIKIESISQLHHPRLTSRPNPMDIGLCRTNKPTG